MKTYLTLFFTYLSICLSAQTLIGPTIGYDFATLETQHILQKAVYGPDDRILETPLEIKRSREDTPSGRRSITFGFQLQKVLSQEWSLALRGSYSKKEYTEFILNSITTFIAPAYELFYRQTSISVLFNRKIKNKISFGIGPNISHFSGWNSVFDWNRDSSPLVAFVPYQVTKRSYGLDFQLGYYLGLVYLAADYTRSLKVVDSSGYMTGASSLAISGTYFFELRKRM